MGISPETAASLAEPFATRSLPAWDYTPATRHAVTTITDATRESQATGVQLPTVPRVAGELVVAAIESRRTGNDKLVQQILPGQALDGIQRAVHLAVQDEKTGEAGLRDAARLAANYLLEITNNAEPIDPYVYFIDSTNPPQGDTPTA